MNWGSSGTAERQMQPHMAPKPFQPSFPACFGGGWKSGGQSRCNHGRKEQNHGDLTEPSQKEPLLNDLTTEGPQPSTSSSAPVIDPAQVPHLACENVNKPHHRHTTYYVCARACACAPLRTWRRKMHSTPLCRMVRADCTSGLGVFGVQDLNGETQSCSVKWMESGSLVSTSVAAGVPLQLLLPVSAAVLPLPIGSFHAGDVMLQFDHFI